METGGPHSTTAGSTTNSSTSSVGAAAADFLFTSPNMHPLLRSCLISLLSISTLADVVSISILETILTSGKYSFVIFFLIQLVLVLIWLPFWLLSFVISEWGIYILAISFVFLVGRSIIRMIAFPGSSQRVATEIETEFTKYSVKMIVSACNTCIDLASALLATSKPTDNNKSATASTTTTTTNATPTTSTSSSSSYTYYEIPGLWKRAKSYRDRVLAVYSNVLIRVLDPHNAAPTSNNSVTFTNKYGNNELVGDVGNLADLTPAAKSDGRELSKLLVKVLTEIDRLEQQAKQLLETPIGVGAPKQAISNHVQMTANSLIIVASELRDFCSSLQVPSSSSGDIGDGDDEEELTVDAVRRRLEDPTAAAANSSAFDAVKSGIASILPMVDPPLRTSIFGFDVQRGCLLSRYQKARQIWVRRKSGKGMLDVLCIPAAPNSSSNGNNSRRRAVLYCNPNAGLIEVATGMSLAGGNIQSDDTINDNCWADFYTNLGFDVYLFNYAGFGRSFGAGILGGTNNNDAPRTPGVLGRLKRISYNTLLGFQPTPDTLREDGLSVASYLLSDLGVESLVIHGESLGGLAASSSARHLSQSSFTKDKLDLLICDRTFCNLEACAQRLVGGWSGYAIRCLTPFWSTDVAGDFIGATCPKVVATDAADAIVADSASLKAGIALWKEIRRGMSTTKAVGWIMEAPLEVRMADFENVCVNDSRFVQTGFRGTQAPVWPADKHISLEEAFHFAACAKRIGKVASMENKKFREHLSHSLALQEEGGEASTSNECTAPVFLLWKVLGCCDGLTGSALGMAVRGGFDCTVTWLCSTVIFGGQTVMEAAEHRLKLSQDEVAANFTLIANKILAQDFDNRPPGYEKQETETVVHPKPIPEVIQFMKDIMENEANANDQVLQSVNHEIKFVIGVLEYIVARLSSAPTVEANWKNRHLQQQTIVGSFLNLHCGHNNPFSKSERKRLKTCLLQATAESAAAIPTV